MPDIIIAAPGVRSNYYNSTTCDSTTLMTRVEYPMLGCAVSPNITAGGLTGKYFVPVFRLDPGAADLRRSEPAAPFGPPAQPARLLCGANAFTAALDPSTRILSATITGSSASLTITRSFALR